MFDRQQGLTDPISCAQLEVHGALSSAVWDVTQPLAVNEAPYGRVSSKLGSSGMRGMS